MKFKATISSKPHTAEDITAMVQRQNGMGKSSPKATNSVKDGATTMAGQRGNGVAGQRGNGVVVVRNPTNVWNRKKSELIQVDRDEYKSLCPSLEFVFKFETSEKNLINKAKICCYLDNNLCQKHLVSLLISLKNLIVLDLSSSAIEQLPRSICSLETLRELILGYTDKLNSLPLEIGKLNNLNYIMLDYSNVSRLPESIGELKNLKTLLHKGLAKMPSSAGQLESLQHLRTNIPVLPDTFKYWVNLMKLDLTGSIMTHLPDEIDKLKNLKGILLCNMENLWVLPDSLGDLDNLEFIDIHGSKITEGPLPPMFVEEEKFTALLRVRFGNESFLTDELKRKLIKNRVDRHGSSMWPHILMEATDQLDIDQVNDFKEGFRWILTHCRDLFVEFLQGAYRDA